MAFLCFFWFRSLMGGWYLLVYSYSFNQLKIKIFLTYLLTTIAANVLTAVLKFGMSIRETFSNSIAIAVSVNMIQVLWCRSKQFLGTSTMLLVKGSSETGLFRHLSDYVFEVRNIANKKSLRIIFFFKILRT